MHNDADMSAETSDGRWLTYDQLAALRHHRPVSPLREPEVREMSDPSVVQQNVGRLHVPVHDPGAMERVETAREILGQTGCCGRLERSPAHNRGEAATT